MNNINYNDSDLILKGVDIGCTDMFSYQGQPCTGIIQESDSNNKLMYELSYVNGFKEGVQKCYFSDGQIEEEYIELSNLTVDYFNVWNNQGILIYHAIHDDKGRITDVLINNLP